MEFKVGDIVRFAGKGREDSVPEFYYETEHIDQSLIKHGSTIWNGEDCEVKGIHNGYIAVEYTGNNAQKMCLAFRASNLSLVKKGSRRPKKEKPIVKYVVIEDSCNNFRSIWNSYEDAEMSAKGASANLSIYRLVKVAEVQSERKVIKVRAPVQTKGK